MITEVVNNAGTTALQPARVGVAASDTPEKATEREKPAGKTETTGKEVARKEVSKAELEQAVGETSQLVRRDLNFVIDESVGTAVVKIIDSKSKEVVRQIPPEEMLALARRMKELTKEEGLSGEQVKGLLMATKA